MSLKICLYYLVVSHSAVITYTKKLEAQHIKSEDCMLYFKHDLLVFRDFFQFLVCTDSVHKVWLLIVIRGKDDIQHHTLQGLKYKFMNSLANGNKQSKVW